MKKAFILLSICLFIMVTLTAGLAQIKFLHQATVVGKLSYDQYSEYPYFLLGKKEIIGLKVDLDKTWEVRGPMSLITADTEYHGLKFIDLSQGKGSLKQLP
jgi:hypothetical protein